MDPNAQVHGGKVGTGAAVIFPQSGVNPAQVHMDRVKSAAAAEQAQQAADNKARATSLASLTKFDTTGWYRHNEILTKGRDELQKVYADSWSQGLNPDNPSTGDLYVTTQKTRKDLKNKVAYSKQLKDHYKAQVARLEGKQDAFTVESVQAFEKYYNSTFNEQMETLPPVLQERVELQDWWGEFLKGSTPSTKGSTLDRGGIKIVNIGANKAANIEQASTWIKHMEPETQQRVLDYYGGDMDAAITGFADNLNSRADVKYERTEKPVADVYGSGEVTSDNPLALGTSQYTVPITYRGTFQGNQGVTGYNEIHIPTAKKFQINSQEKLLVDEGKYVRNNTINTTFMPQVQVDFQVASNDATIIIDKKMFKIQAGDILPDEVVTAMQEGNFTGNLTTTSRTFVRGLEDLPVRESTRTSTGQTGMGSGGGGTATTETPQARTIYVPLSSIEKDMRRNLDDYGVFMDKVKAHNQYGLGDPGGSTFLKKKRPTAY